MSTEVSALKKISNQLNDRYRQFLELDPIEALRMPASQLNYFLNQAMTRHYYVTLHLTGDDEPTMTGYLSRGPRDTILVTFPHQTMTSVAHLSQIKYVSRLDYSA